VLAADVVAPIDIPPFDNTAMDGYAVRSADCHRHGATTLAVLGVLPAGIAPSTRVGQGQALRIMTGAPIPDGADAVVMIEYTESAEDGRYVRFERRVAAGDHVRIAGSDVVAGSTVLRAGLTLTPAQLGLLASVGAGLESTAAARMPRTRLLRGGRSRHRARRREQYPCGAGGSSLRL
jgi:molybdopterin molybdotransferase